MNKDSKKRKVLDTESNEQDNLELGVPEDIYSFDGEKHLKIFKIYISQINKELGEIKKVIEKKNKEKIKDDSNYIKDEIGRIKALKHNIYYNTYNLNKINTELKEIDKKLKVYREALCDHNIYSESQYHNERYYYCKKCTLER